MLATPGKSQHNLGLAVDVHTASDPKRLKWLIANVLKFGFSWEVVPSEPWHIRYTEGDQVPQAVKEWLALNPKDPGIFGTPAEQKAAATAATEAVIKAQEPKKIDVSIANGKPRIIKDYKGKAVREAQELLTKHGFQCRPDGDFGPKTQELVKQFQKSKSIPITGEVDELTWAALLS